MVINFHFYFSNTVLTVIPKHHSNDSSDQAQALCDATFQIGDKKQVFHVVAALFATHSEELNAMLRDNKDEVIVIEDITDVCFQFLRQYFYSLNPVMCLKNISDM